MPATIEPPDTNERADWLERSNRTLTIAVVILAFLALGWAAWQATGAMIRRQPPTR